MVLGRGEPNLLQVCKPGVAIPVRRHNLVRVSSAHRGRWALHLPLVARITEARAEPSRVLDGIWRFVLDGDSAVLLNLVRELSLELRHDMVTYAL